MLFAHQDKVFHAGAYFIMAVLAWGSFSKMSGHKITILASILFCSIYGITDEWHQSFVLGRDSDVADWLADTIGAIVAVMLLQWVIPRFFSKRRTIK